MNIIESLRAKISANPLLSALASAGLGYLAVKYGPAIQSVCAVVQK